METMQETELARLNSQREYYHRLCREYPQYRDQWSMHLDAITARIEALDPDYLSE